MIKEIWKECVALGLAGAIYFSPAAVEIYMNSKFKDIGEEFSVREIGNQRQFYIGAEMGLARLAIDENKDGTLDKVYRNMPISPMMGGPGYRLMETETTATDREKFARAERLLSQAK
ncbi:hypothetical protein K9L67_03400 [Candidatus Woesearchaeota archaeon]|nr:hypothetical protein [Candidatus Woesearchaeota archaeon]MCF7901248.1 hypothetical protein [Candidatus Woesearchaeota archaeon]MCF8012845.1 hypothetical protein [Candidatus Woesearchaeota archaeon]